MIFFKKNIPCIILVKVEKKVFSNARRISFLFFSQPVSLCTTTLPCGKKRCGVSKKLLTAPSASKAVYKVREIRECFRSFLFREMFLEVIVSQNVSCFQQAFEAFL